MKKDGLENMEKEGLENTEKMKLENTKKDGLENAAVVFADKYNLEQFNSVNIWYIYFEMVVI